MRTLPILNKAYMLILAMSLTFTSCNLESILGGLLDEDDEEEGDYSNSDSKEPSYEIVDFSDFENEPYAEYAAKYEIEGVDYIGSVELLADGNFVIMPPESEKTKADMESFNSAGTRSSIGYIDGSWIYAYGQYDYLPTDDIYFLKDIGTMCLRDGSVAFDFSDCTLDLPLSGKQEGRYYVEQLSAQSSLTKAICRRWVAEAYHNIIVGYMDYEKRYYDMVYNFGFESYITFSPYGTYLSGCFDEYGWDVPDCGHWEITKSGEETLLRYYYYDGEEHLLESYEAKIDFVRYAGKSGRYMRIIPLRKGYLGDTPRDLEPTRVYFILREQPYAAY